MQKHFQLFLAGTMALVIASCSKSNTEGRYIPATASVVMQLNSKSLPEKLPWAEIKNNPLFKELYNDSTVSAAIKKLMDDPSHSGIDMSKDLMFFIQKDSLGGYVGIEGGIKNKDDFKIFNLEITSGGSESEKDGVDFLSHFPLCMGWNKERFVYILDAPQLGQMDQLSKRMRNDSIDIPNYPSRDIGATCRSVFAVEENNSLAKDEKFTKIMDEPGDIRFWINMEQLMSNSSAMPGMMSLDKLSSGNVATAAVNFDKGKININLFSYAGKELTRLYKKYSDGKINEDMLKRMPGKDIDALIALHFDPEGIREFLKLMGLDGFVNLAKSTLGFDLDDFVKANKGDILLGLSDFRVETDTSKYLYKDEDEMERQEPKPKFSFVFAASIGDKEAFNKLVNAGKKAGESLLNNKEMPLFYNSNDKYFALGNSKENVDGYLSGGNNNSALISKITGQPFGGFVNLQLFMKAFEIHPSKDSAAKNLYDLSLKTWDNILWRGGEYKDGAITQSFEINLVDKNTSSLIQLNQYTGKLAEMQLVRRKKQKEDMMAFEDAVGPAAPKDSTATAPQPREKEK